MKKTIRMLLWLALALSLVACGAETTDTSSPIAMTEATTANATDGAGEQVADKSIDAAQLLQNIDARLAIARAFDKAYITENIMRNGSKPIDYFVPVGLAVSEDGTDFRAAYPDGWNHYDATAAQRHWQAAKDELNFETVKLRFLTFDSLVYQKTSQYIKQQLEKNLEGLEVVLIQQPFNNKIILSESGKFDIEYTGWGPDYPDALTFLDLWVKQSGYNSAGYANADYDERIRRAKSGDLTTDLPARTVLLQEAEHLLVERDCVVVPLYQRGISALQSPKVKGIIYHRFGGDYSYAGATTEIETDGKKLIRLCTVADIPTVDNNRATNAVSFEVIANVMEGLTTLGEGDVLLPAGATSWQVSDDGTEYTFNLERDAVWSNGAAVTAHDYVYSWRRLADPATQAQYQSMIETAKIENCSDVISGRKPVEALGVKALDDYTLQIKLQTAVPYFLKLVSFPSFYPINQQFAEAQAERFGSSIETTLYNGPYTISRWQIGYGYTIAKNDTYWNKAAVLNDGVDFRIVKDAVAAVNLYELGEIDRANVSGEFAEQYLDHPHFQVEDATAVFYLTFNIGNRQADE